MLTVRDVTVRYGTLNAVDGVSFAVPAGKILAVMGPSGCGKTTLLRAVAGLEAVDSGSIWWAGNELTTVPVHRREIGLMFQDYALFPHRSVSGNVAFGLRMHGHDDPTSRVEEMLDIVGLTGCGDRSVGTLSGGQQQRVALARTLAPSPRLVLLDEPLGSLDRALRDELVAEMRAIFAALDMTAVYVTHDRDEAFAIADEVAIMTSGRIERTGLPEAVWKAPASISTARLLGMQNIIDTVDARRWVDVDHGSAQVVIHPWAVTVTDDAPRNASAASATVVASRFASGVYRIVLQPEEGPVVIGEARRRIPAGTVVRMDIDPTGVIALG